MSAKGIKTTIVQVSADEVISAAGAHAASATKRTTRYDITTAGDNITSVLADGAIPGQRKTLFADTASGGKTAVITPTTKTGFATITLSTAKDMVELEWQTTRGWLLVHVNGTPTIA